MNSVYLMDSCHNLDRESTYLWSQRNDSDDRLIGIEKTSKRMSLKIENLCTGF